MDRQFFLISIDQVGTPNCHHLLGKCDCLRRWSQLLLLYHSVTELFTRGEITYGPTGGTITLESYHSHGWERTASRNTFSLMEYVFGCQPGESKVS